MVKPFAKLISMLTPKRRWAQFRLRTLLALVVVVAIPCGWLKWKMVRKDKERAAVAEIKRVGGHTRYDWEFPFRANASPPGVAWQRTLLGDDFFASVSFAHLSTDEIDDKWLLHLEPLTELTWLYFGHRGRNINITDDGVHYLTRFKRLTHLGLDGTGGGTNCRHPHTSHARKTT